MPYKDRERRREYHREYDRKYQRKNKERILKLRKQWKLNNKEIHKENQRQERSRHKLNYRIRGQTYRKYGKLPKGYEYHHTTEPYGIDEWICVFASEHRAIDVVYGRYKNVYKV